MSFELLVIEPVSIEPGEQMSPSVWAGWSDWIGLAASIGCAIHCAAMPFVIAYLPALGLSFLANEAFHKWMAVGCFAIALTAFVPGFRKHRRLMPVIVASVGLVMISTAAFGFAGECCAACETNEASWATACKDSCCPHCAEKTANEENSSQALSTATMMAADRAPSNEEQADSRRSDDTATTELSSLAFLVPWLTPVGGLILVTAHLLNRRYGCLCGCCKSEPTIQIA